jgi:hypothetical protein
VVWARYVKIVSILMAAKLAEEQYARGSFVAENFELMVCKLEDGVVYSFGQTMLVFHGDPLLRRDNEIIDRVVEVDL